MSSCSCLLDTNAVIALADADVRFLLQLEAGNRASLPFVVLGELEYGARRSTRPAANLAAIENLLAEFDLVLPDRETSAWYGRIQTELRKKGRPIPSNDVWIDALAMRHEAVLVTRDGHFRHVDGLRTRSW